MTFYEISSSFSWEFSLAVSVAGADSSGLMSVFGFGGAAFAFDAVFFSDAGVASDLIAP